MAFVKKVELLKAKFLIKCKIDFVQMQLKRILLQRDKINLTFKTD